jgi:hypothetical protein
MNLCVCIYILYHIEYHGHIKISYLATIVARALLTAGAAGGILR